MQRAKERLGYVRPSSTLLSQPKHGSENRFRIVVVLLAIVVSYLWVGAPAHAAITAVSLQAPALGSGTTDLISPVHFQATAESDTGITGYVVYVDGQEAYQTLAPLLDAWVVVAPGSHSVYVKAWASDGSLLSTSTYDVSVTGFATPDPPASAMRVTHIAESTSWVVDNDPGVGGQCNDGSFGTFQSASDPNTANSPDSPGSGQLFTLTSKCQYDDSLFYKKDSRSPYPYAGDTNFIWDFWFYLPSTTQNSSIQALENDFFQAVQLSDGVHEFMFGSQCNYATNQWQFWLPNNGKLTWMNVGLSPCQFATGAWHHATYFVQRVTAGGYQKIPATFNSSSDTNTSLRFGTLTIDGNTMYLGGLSFSTIPGHWSPVLGVQHQLDSAKSGVTIEEYDDKESVIAW